MPDVRLIDANALRKDIHTSYSDDLGILEHIDNSPTIDAQPVKHGHWIIEKEEPMYRGHRKIWALRCSECRKDPIKHIGGGMSNWWFQTPEFCPVCGSDNRGDSDADS